MKSAHKNILLLAFCLLVIIFACNKKATDYQKFFGGKEIVYPGAVTNVQAYPGNGRVMLTWHPSPDPNVSKYVVYWNNYADSALVNAISHNPSDTVKVIINNLNEYPYSFFINSYDAAGNKSVTSELDNARVYGKIYRANLFNRPVNTDTPYTYNEANNSASLKFFTPDTVNVTTKISYTQTNGNTAIVNLGASSDSILLQNYKFGTRITYQSSYKPTSTAIDTFMTTAADTFPTIYKFVQCDRSKYVALQLPTDITAAYGTTFQLMWDGNRTPRSYPDVFNSDGNSGFPRQFTMDLGQIYNLGQMEMVGRTCCHNPTDYQIWGIADTTNALVKLSSNDGNWESQAASNGWTKLTEVVRTDKAQDGVTAESPWPTLFSYNAPKVRYLVVRILKTADGSNEINISQLTFWNKQ